MVKYLKVIEEEIPEITQCDHGSEFRTKVVYSWAYEHSLKLDFCSNFECKTPQRRYDRLRMNTITSDHMVLCEIKVPKISLTKSPFQ